MCVNFFLRSPGTFINVYKQKYNLLTNFSLPFLKPHDDDNDEFS